MIFGVYPLDSGVVSKKSDHIVHAIVSPFFYTHTVDIFPCCRMYFLHRILKYVE